MTIASFDQYIAAPREVLNYTKTASRTAVAASPFSVFDLAGSPGAGTLAIGNTANGVVPTDTTAGYPTIAAFGGGATGYLTRVEFSNTVASKLALYDCLFSCGAYAFNANTTLASQPSYVSRLPSVGGYSTTEIWVEAVTAFTGIPSVAVTYTNQSGTAGRSTGTVAAPAALIVGRMYRLPLQAGDIGVQSIQTIVGSVATAGTFNVHVMRRLWQGRVRIANDGAVHDMLSTGAPILYDTSALRCIVTADGTATGNPDISFEIANA